MHYNLVLKILVHRNTRLAYDDSPATFLTLEAPTHKNGQHTQTTRGKLPTDCLSVFDRWSRA